MSNILVLVAATLQLVGNVLDAPLWLSGTRFGTGASLTVSGTRTDLTTATVSSATGLGTSAAVFPWQITTTGIDWTTQSLSSQLRFSNGNVSFGAEAIDANNLVVGAQGGLSTGSVTASPATGAMVISQLSRALPPVINASGQAQTGTAQLIFQNLSFDAPPGFGEAGSNLYGFAGGLGVGFNGCEMNFSSTTDFIVNTYLILRLCRWTMSGNSVFWRVGGADPSIVGPLIVGTGSTLYTHSTGNASYSNATFCRARLCVTQAQISIGTTHVRKAANPVLIQRGGSIAATGILNGSAPAGNTGIAIDIPFGRYSYVNAGNKPTIVAGTDPRVGGVTRTLAQLPFVALQTDQAPNTVTTLTGNGAAIVQE